MKVSIRRFEKKDIPLKVRWINDAENNAFLHYDIPICEEKTLIWFERIKDREDRYDAVIEADGIPCGLIGLLSIDQKNGKAEYYIVMGEAAYKGKGIAKAASMEILRYGFEVLGLNRIYLYTERENTAAQRLFARVGFRREGLLKDDLFSRGKYVDRYAYGIVKRQFEGKTQVEIPHTLIQYLGEISGNKVYMKREDLLPFSFGGNKARKARRFFQDIDAGDYDCVVTYGSGSSNHCRIVANMAAARGMICLIISAEETSKRTYNSELMNFFGARIITCPISDVHNVIEHTLTEMRLAGHNPYFIPGGGHGNLGTEAYVECYDEIVTYEEEKGVHFDYIFFASGTGTTHAGLVCAKLMRQDRRKIVGISIARRNPRGRQVVVDSISEYLKDYLFETDEIEQAVEFCDEYILSGYGSYDVSIDEIVKSMMLQYGIPMDTTYTGKAFCGMQKYLAEHGILDKRVLFIHTGGTPLFFDYLKEKRK